MDSGSLPIPADLCGRQRSCRPRWRRIAKKAVAARSWSQGLAGRNWIRLSDAPELLVLLGPDPLLAQEDVRLYLVAAELHAACERPPDYTYHFDAYRGLLLEGLKEFWFCLAMLGGQGGLFRLDYDQRPDAREVYVTMLGSWLAWWDVFCELGDRFFSLTTRGWPSWGIKVASFLGLLGFSEEPHQLVAAGPGEAKEVLRDALKKLSRCE